MANKNNNLLNQLNSIRQRQIKDAELIEQIKQDADADLLEDLTEIEKRNWNTIIEIDSLRKKINPEKLMKSERCKVLQMAMNKTWTPTRVGSVRI